jgi:hypothetical protein
MLREDTSRDHEIGLAYSPCFALGSSRRHRQKAAAQTRPSAPKIANTVCQLYPV